MQLTRAGLVDIKSFIIIWIHTHTHFNVRIFGFGLLCTHFKRSIVVWKEKRLWIFSVCFLCKRKELIWRKYSNNRANSVVFRYPIRIFEWRAISRQIPFNVKFIVRKQPDTFSNQVIFEPPVLNRKKWLKNFSDIDIYIKYRCVQNLFMLMLFLLSMIEQERFSGVACHCDRVENSMVIIIIFDFEIAQNNKWTKKQKNKKQK